MTKTASFSARITQLRLYDRVCCAFTLRSEVLPQDQTVASFRRGHRLPPREMRVFNEMNASFFRKHSDPTQPLFLQWIHRWLKQPAACLIAKCGIRSGARTANQLLMSLWLALPFALFLTSDWIGMIVLFHALSASTRLLKNSANREQPETSGAFEVIRGGYRAR